MAASAGLRGPVYLDCLTYPPASDLERCRRSLRWVAALRDSGPTGVAPLVAIGNLGHGASREECHAWQMTYVTMTMAAGARAMILPVEDAALVSLVRVLEGHAAPRTAFEEWAVELCAGGGDVPPPGERLRSSWELLRDP